MLPKYQLSVGTMSEAIRSFPWENKEAYAQFLAQTYYYICHSTRLLESVIADADVPLSGLALLSADERRQALVDWNATRAEYPGTTLHGWIEERVRQTPDAVRPARPRR